MWGILFALAAIALAVAATDSPNAGSALVAAGIGGIACAWHLTRWAERQ